MMRCGILGSTHRMNVRLLHADIRVDSILRGKSISIVSFLKGSWTALVTSPVRLRNNIPSWDSIGSRCCWTSLAEWLSYTWLYWCSKSNLLHWCILYHFSLALVVCVDIPHPTLTVDSFMIPLLAPPTHDTLILYQVNLSSYFLVIFFLLSF